MKEYPENISAFRPIAEMLLVNLGRISHIVARKRLHCTKRVPLKAGFISSSSSTVSRS